MQTSHEWPQPPSSSSRRKLTRESLASVDWHKARRYESYSDGDDELHTREPLEAACQSSGYREGRRIQSSGAGDGKDNSQSTGYGKGKEIHSSDEGFHHGEVQEMQSSGYQAGYGLCKDFLSSGYGDYKGFVLPSITTKIISSNKEGKTNFPANHRVDHRSILPQQPPRLTTSPFPGAKLAGKPNTARLIIPAHVTSEESTSFDAREPFSPEVTCLGRVRIKEKHSHNTEHTHMEHPQTHVLESKKQAMDKNHKDGLHKGSSKREITAEKRSCLPRRKKREDMELGTLKLFGPSSSTVVPSETTETRRERAALLARSLTSLLEDLRQLDMENSGYVPAVPPPNSLLLMRGFGVLNKSCNQEVSTLLSGNAFQSEEDNRGINEHSCTHSSANGILLHDIKTQKTMKLMTSVENSSVAAPSKVFPLSEIESNSLVQNASPSATMNNKPPMGNCPQELALWQRRAIAKLAAIDTKRPMRMEIKKPSTK